ncbi:hypothetical protein [Flexibacterium corallicola]|uniref:hypothetical protein n=1 Tax=Flexibacterium corallicola TaxID=3037259 RepID=UPI00286F299B|nr:hypothetical protein [Pseudovibrio sp. M1P-2-3]
MPLVLQAAQKKDLRARWCSQTLPKLKSLLWKESKFAVGHAFTLADIFVAVIYRKARSHGMPVDREFEEHCDFLKLCKYSPPELSKAN